VDTQPAAATERRVDLEFRDQSLEEVAQALTEMFPKESIIVPPSIANVRVTLRLRMATLPQALRAITLATEGRVNVTSEDPSLHSFSATRELAPPAAACRIYSLANYLSGKPDDGFDEAIKGLMVVLDKAVQHLNSATGAKVNEPRLEFHKPTKLLIAVGTEPELAILTQIVQALGGASSDAPLGGFPGMGAPGAPGYPPGNTTFGPVAPGLVPPPPPAVPAPGAVAPAPRRR